MSKRDNTQSEAATAFQDSISRQSLSEIAKQQAVIAEKLGRLEAQP